MATLKTPGVYVQEISKFPPSVAPVGTAIPAFIGYTEKAEELNGDPLTMIPKRITSMLEYETYFGRAVAETSIEVTITDDVSDGTVNRTLKVSPPSSPSKYKMYYSMQMYFANGGGPCYIVSVNDYATGAGNVTLAKLEEGLAKIRKEDEPTLLLFPDATGLTTETDFFSIYNSALTQCHDLQDRFTIIDTHTDDENDDPIGLLRTNITSDTVYAKYGAAYYPFLDTVLDYNYDEDNTIITHTTNEPGAIAQIEENLAVISDSMYGIPAIIDGLFREMPDVNPYDVGALATYVYGTLNAEPAASASIDAAQRDVLVGLMEPVLSKMATLIEYKYKLVDEINAADQVDDTTVDFSVALSDFVEDFEGADKIEEVYANMTELYSKFNSTDSSAKLKNLLVNNNVNLKSELEDLVLYDNNTTGTGVTTFTTNLFGAIETNMSALFTLVDSIEDTNSGILDGRSLKDIETIDNTAYNAIKAEISATPLTLPPSSAMAGIYARVDNNVGVWKAPANVGVSYVVKPTVQISQEEQADMNVTSSGKSVNAIRTFTGKGTMVWGARTLAGNDNEWRYISVRRFFNFVEESVSQATETFVFEPNNANTWVRVGGMIENFLLQQWKAGALAGAKPEEAFYVRIGLGSTMTSQDILEGRMIVEIGMAAVRPAEFIVLRFSHKMQES